LSTSSTGHGDPEIIESMESEKNHFFFYHTPPTDA